ncbi:MAG: ATP-binding protein [Myxococcota bacterium]
MTHLIDWLERWIPEGLEADDDAARRARLAVWLGAIGVITSALFTTAEALAGVSALAVADVALTLGCASVLPCLRITRSLTVTAHAYAAIVMLGITVNIWFTGGIQAPALSWYLLVPILAGMLGGLRAGALWVPITSALVATLAVAQWYGLTPPSALDTPLALRVNQIVVPAILILAIYAILGTYEAARARSMQRVEEALAAARRSHDSARRVLDTVHEGLMMVRPDGSIEPERSAALRRLLPRSADPGARVWDLFEGPSLVGFREAFELHWLQLADGILPPHVVLAQLPTRLVLGGRHLVLRYPRGAETSPGAVLIVVRDGTHAVQAEQAEVERQESLAIFTRLLRDRSGVHEFLEESRSVLRDLADASASPEQHRRWLHTLKGNCAVVGLQSLARHLHGLEDALDDDGARHCTERELTDLKARWTAVERRLAPLLVSVESEGIVVERRTFERTLARLAGRASPEAVRAVEALAWVPVEARLAELADQARRLAERGGKLVTVDVHAEGAPRIELTDAWRGFWSALVHVVRNAVDHGVERPDVRRAHGKPARARVTLVARVDEHLVVEVSDDGAGIDWAALEARAAARGLEAAPRSRLVFLDGVTSRTTVTEVSGRGRGGPALLEATERLGGTVEVRSTPGQGATFTFRLPRQDVWVDAPPLDAFSPTSGPGLPAPSHPAGRAAWGE